MANHPNQWFQASVNYHKLKNGKAIGDDSAASSAVPVTATAAGASETANAATTTP